MFADEFGFAGDADSYDAPLNADLIRVLDRRRGLPVSLSLLYVAAARRIGWTAHALNTPYSGGHILDRHGDPAHGIHAIQIEWSRALYLDAALDRPGPGLSRVAATLGAMIDALADEAVGGPLPLAAE